MAGTWCTGIATDNRHHLLDVRAYAEGVEYRLGDTALNNPITDNPHLAGTPSADAWDAGWNDANGATIEGCVAAPGRVAPI